MTSKGQARDLNQGSSNALLGLLRSIAPDAVPEEGKKLGEDDVKKINERLTELLGKEAVEHYSKDENARGELVNEEGLPIVDVTEPAEAINSRATGTTVMVEEDKLISHASLSEAERSRLRQERDRILDLLEEEEMLEERREKERFTEERKEFIRKKMEGAAKEMDRTKAAKDVQRKMGKALLGDSGRTADKSKQDGDALPSESSRPKKSVSFAAEPEHPEASGQESFGDISLATLRKTNRPTLLATVADKGRPMKTKVVERKPVGKPAVQTNRHHLPDSDDESNSDANADEQPSDSSISDTDVTDEGLEDIDNAQHQREIAIKYYAKRGIIGQTAAQAMVAHSHAEDEDEREIPLDIGVTEPLSKPSISHFKASKLVSSYNASLPPESKSLDGSILSAHSAKTLQDAIRTGGLDSQNRLVGTDEDSEPEMEDEALLEVLELLKKGEVYNVGPEGDQILHTVPPIKKEEPGTVTGVSTAKLPPLNKPKNSKFMVDRSHAGPSKAGQNQAKSISTNSKVSTTPQTATPGVIERRPPGATSTSSTGGMAPTAPVVVESPSFPRIKPTLGRSVVSQPPPSTQQSGSPFPLPQKNKTSAPFSMVVDSPSFPPPKGILQAPSKSAFATSQNFPKAQPPPNQAAPSRRPIRPPVVMSSVVRERSGQSSVEKVDQVDNTNPSKPKKVSRFLAEKH